MILLIIWEYLSTFMLIAHAVLFLPTQKLGCQGLARIGMTTSDHLYYGPIQVQKTPFCIHISGGGFSVAQSNNRVRMDGRGGWPPMRRLLYFFPPNGRKSLGKESMSTWPACTIVRCQRLKGERWQRSLFLCNFLSARFRIWWRGAAASIARFVSTSTSRQMVACCRARTVRC